jgi:hypothetical protein
MRWISERDRFAGAALPGAAACRSPLRRRVCGPQPAGDSDQSAGVRRPGILAGPEAPVRGPVPLAAGERDWGHDAVGGPKLQVLLAAGNPEAAQAALVWRHVCATV